MVGEVGFDFSLGPGVTEEDIFGFRTPFLKYNNATFEALQAEGFVYDCSIEEGYQPDHDGTNYYWPYTLDEGSPGCVAHRPGTGLAVARNMLPRHRAGRHSAPVQCSTRRDA